MYRLCCTVTGEVVVSPQQLIKQSALYNVSVNAFVRNCNFFLWFNAQFKYYKIN